MSQVYEVAPGVLMIDTLFQGVPGAIMTFLFETDEGYVLTDIGPSTVHASLLAGLAEAGVEAEDLRRIVVTHIHLDHSGGVGLLLQRFPHIRVSVNRDAASILVDPAALVRSASRSFGDRMERLWGAIVPVPEASIDPLDDGDVVPGSSLRAMRTPGHAGTHLAFHYETTGVLFAGDAAHARLHGSDVIVPTLAPPELDFEAWAMSVARMRAVSPVALALPHGGWFTDAASHIDRIMPTIDERIAMAEGIMRSPDDQDALTDAFAADTVRRYAREGGDVDGKIAALELAMPSYLGGQGMARWFKVTGRFGQADSSSGTTSTTTTTSSP